jgi:RimJ/RimL family protein N-acetyltransferase
MPQHLLKNNLLLTVREAQPEDAEHLLAFAEQIADESENITRMPGELGMSVEQERELLQESLLAPYSLYLVAEVAGEIAGNLGFLPGRRQRMRHSGSIGIGVAKKHWNLGIGGHLLAELITWARAGGVIRKINLHVRVDNLPAIHLYEKYGFVHEGREMRGLCIRGEFIDLYAMGLLIDPE